MMPPPNTGGPFMAPPWMSPPQMPQMPQAHPQGGAQGPRQFPFNYSRLPGGGVRVSVNPQYGQ